MHQHCSMNILTVNLAKINTKWQWQKWPPLLFMYYKWTRHASALSILKQLSWKWILCVKCACHSQQLSLILVQLWLRYKHNMIGPRMLLLLLVSTTHSWTSLAIVLKWPGCTWSELVHSGLTLAYLLWPVMTIVIKQLMSFLR